ncbi:ribonuclease HII [Salidesulfovibrio brasiliensis]|uniref:ribonuclease HII n=1 Tax=Salidesulfovibrio brasiliensis TaxID=221711 RepID=UPI0006D2C118|nr:ribonuclease HII [Salidesulfovibrio brasiliensis]
MRMGSLITTASIPADSVAGVDEAGRGCLAGPVVAGAVVLPDAYDLPLLTDSKKLSAEQREILYDAIREQALCWAVGVIWAPEIDRINILQATFRAMGNALAHLRNRPKLARIDGNHVIPDHVLPFDMAQEAVIKGDGKIPAISAASIMAKTFRDRLMVKLARRYPAYGFDKHMGYGTKVHLEALKERGPCRQHRMSFKGVLPEKKAEKQAGLPF